MSKNLLPKEEFQHTRIMAKAWAAKGSDLTESEYAKVLAFEKDFAELHMKLSKAEKEFTAAAEAAKGDSEKISAAYDGIVGKATLEILYKQKEFREMLSAFREQPGVSGTIMSSLAWLGVPQGTAWQQNQAQQRKLQEESAARLKWRLFHESKTIDQVSRMTGAQFEDFLAILFSRMGYKEISLTPPNDQGGDLLCVSPAGARVVIQAKRWRGTVGNSALQELLGAMLHYNRSEGMVVTNSAFTRAARELAKNGRVTLCDGEWLREKIGTLFPPEIPEFNWEEYNKYLKDYRPFRV